MKKLEDASYIECRSFTAGANNDVRPLHSGESSDISVAQLQEYVSLLESGQLELKVGPRFAFEDLQEAHALIDDNRANGKIVIEVNCGPTALQTGTLTRHNTHYHRTTDRRRTNQIHSSCGSDFC